MIKETEYQGKDVELNRPTKGDVKKQYVIYMTINLINNKKYIGQDINNNPKYLGSGVLLKKAIKKYGKNSFKKIIIDICENLEVLNQKEVFWIKEYDAVNSNEFYNIDFGGRNGGNTALKKMPENSKLIISKKIKEKWTNSNYRERVITNKIGYNHITKTKEKISKTLKEKYNNNQIVNPFKDKKHSNITKNKISKSKLGRNIGSDNHKSISVVLLDNNYNFISKYNTLTEASIDSGVQISNISRALKQPIHSNVRKYRWLTTNNYNKFLKNE